QVEDDSGQDAAPDVVHGRSELLIIRAVGLPEAMVAPELRGGGLDHALAQLPRLAAVAVAPQAVEDEVVPLQPHRAVPLAAAGDAGLVAGIVGGQSRDAEAPPELGRAREVLHERLRAVLGRDSRPERQKADDLLAAQVEGRAGGGLYGEPVRGPIDVVVEARLGIP